MICVPAALTRYSFHGRYNNTEVGTKFRGYCDSQVAIWILKIFAEKHPHFKCRGCVSLFRFYSITSFPYFGVKLSCVCLLFAYRKKVITYSDPIVTYSHLKMTYSYPNVNYSGLKVTYS